MGYSVYTPGGHEGKQLPTLYWLSGLTCDDTNFTFKAGAFEHLVRRLDIGLDFCCIYSFRNRPAHAVWWWLCVVVLVLVVHALGGGPIDVTGGHTPCGGGGVWWCVVVVVLVVHAFGGGGPIDATGGAPAV